LYPEGGGQVYIFYNLIVSLNFFWFFDKLSARLNYGFFCCLQIIFKQPSDTGKLGDAQVRYVYRKDGIPVHCCDKPLEAGATVEIQVDWARRFDHMQQHSGQHLISAIAHKSLSWVKNFKKMKKHHKTFFVIFV